MRYRARRHKIPLTRFCRYSWVTTDIGQPDSAMEHKRKEERLPVNPTTTFFVFSKKLFHYFLFLAIGKGVEEQRDIM
jgi:hypothetical protein